jgi:hypothetical protein
VFGAIHFHLIPTSTGVGSHHDNARPFGQCHPRVQQADNAILDHSYDRHGTTARAKVRLQRARHIVGRAIGDGSQRLGGQLFIKGLAALTSGVGLRCWHMILSTR